MNAVVFALPGSEAIGGALAKAMGAEEGQAEFRNFPDGESYIRLLTSVEGRDVILADTLFEPNGKALPLLFTADAARDLGARRIGLVTPYLAYMRQDRRFKPGEAVTSTTFARTLSQWIDWLVTVDPHLHRRSSLGEIYSVPSQVVHAASLIADWIAKNVPNPLVVGPDEESEQWVSEVATGAGAPYIVLTKVRRGDRDVTVSAPDVARYSDRTPVLIDDIISTARTMIEAVKGLIEAGTLPPVCIGVHAVFAGTAYKDLADSGVAKVITCNTVPHDSNGIDVVRSVANAVSGLLDGGKS